MKTLGKIDISIIIVSYNSARDIFRCLNSLRAAGVGFSLEIIIIDNHSTDSTVNHIQAWRRQNQQKFSSITIEVNTINCGFTRASNQGLLKAQGRFFLLLNPDTELTPDCLNKLVAFLVSHPEVGLIAPQLRFADGTIQHSVRKLPLHCDVYWELFGLSRLFPNHPVFNRWKMSGFDHCSTREVDQPQGACMLIPGSVMNEIGLLDERFWMFFSDVDLCQRIKNAGWRIVFFTDVFIYHHKGQSVYANRLPMVVSSHRSFAQYFEKHFTGTRRQWLNGLTKFILLTALVPRMLFLKLKFE